MITNENVKSIMFATGMAVMVFMFARCSSSVVGGGAKVVSGSPGDYQGAGSVWEANFTSTNFTIEKFPTASKASADLVVSGSYVEYSTGFRLLTVTSATAASTETAPTAGTQAYGFDIPNFAFLLKPVGQDSEIMPMLSYSTGACGASNFQGNWIIANFDDGKIISTDNTTDVFGTASFDMSTPANATASITQFSSENAATLGTGAISFDYTTCSNSVLSFTQGVPPETIDMFFTSNGGALVHSYGGSNPSHDSTIFAAPKHTGDVTQAELAGTYSVVVFDSGVSSGDKTFPAKVVFNSAGTSLANRITDITTDAVDPTGIILGPITAKAGSNGLFNLTIDPGGDNGRLNCAFFTVTSKSVIACNGYGSTSGSRRPFFLIGKKR